MHKIQLIIRSTSFRISIIFSMMTLVLLLLLNFLVIKRSEEAFKRVIRDVNLEQRHSSQFELRQEKILIFENGEWREINPEERIQISKGEMPDLLTFKADGSQRPAPLNRKFVEEFQDSLIFIGLISVFLSFLVGFIVSEIFTKPINSLIKGIGKLRDNEYKFKLEKTGTFEIDEVINAFNKLSSELQRVETLRKDLISDTSHELKTPIASLLGQLEAVREGVLNLDNDRIQLLTSEVKRLDELVENLQEFSRIRNNVRKLNITSINLTGLIQNVEKEFEKKLKEKKIKVIYKLNSDFTINADESIIKRVFENLFQNTIRYSKASNITINANSEQIVFFDNGIGIDEKYQKLVFERFYRVEKSRNRKTGGLGLGLAIVKEIIEAHGWKIKIRTPKDRIGVEFVITMK